MHESDLENNINLIRKSLNNLNQDSLHFDKSIENNLHQMSLNPQLKFLMEIIVQLNDKIDALQETSEDGYRCSSCNVYLDQLRDGTTEDGHRCNNCYWEEERSDKNWHSFMIYPDYRK
jgi:hypothetical protein